MKRFVGAAALCCLASGACGGSTENGSVAGIAAEKPLAELTRAETRRLCDWFIDRVSGTYECPGETIILGSQDFECGEPPPSSCVALVGDVQTCANAMAQALGRCDEQDPAACRRLDELCPLDEGVAGGSSGGVGALCVEGEYSRCTCADGANGAQQCEGGLWAPCMCEGPRLLVCQPGEVAPCVCADGTSGSQVCLASGEGFGPCACEPVAPPPVCALGQSRACACPSGAMGVEICEEGGWTPCECRTGSCDPNFCPSSGTGLPCCVTPNGPCGVDVGLGCGTFCAPGATRSCACTDGSAGSQTCDFNGIWSVCTCPPPSSCEPAFCPSMFGTPCCLPNATCGVDLGMGCVAVAAD